MEEIDAVFLDQEGPCLFRIAERGELEHEEGWPQRLCMSLANYSRSSYGTLPGADAPNPRVNILALIQ